GRPVVDVLGASRPMERGRVPHWMDAERTQDFGGELAQVLAIEVPERHAGPHDRAGVIPFVGAHHRLAVGLWGSPAAAVVDGLVQIERVERRGGVLGARRTEGLDLVERPRDEGHPGLSGWESGWPVVELGRPVETRQPVPARHVAARGRAHPRIVANAYVN